jgi:hypothetical protein
MVKLTMTYSGVQMHEMRWMSKSDSDLQPGAMFIVDVEQT